MTVYTVAQLSVGIFDVRVRSHEMRNCGYTELRNIYDCSWLRHSADSAKVCLCPSVFMCGAKFADCAISLTNRKSLLVDHFY